MARPALTEQHYGPQGRPTRAWQKMLDDLFDRLEAAESKLTAISAVTSPSGGGTVDAEARTAIDSIITGAS